MKIERLIASAESLGGKGASRRSFMKLVSMGGAGLAIGIQAVPALANSAAAATEVIAEFAPNAFVRIGTDNTVTVVVKHLEMGQGTYTGISTLVAEELDADWAQVVAEAAPADGERYKNFLFGLQGTGGSTAMANSFMQMRQAGAAARSMLVAAAAERWQVPAAEVTVSAGVLSHASGKSANFGELAEAAAALPVPEADAVALKDPKDFKLIGQVVTRKDVGKTDGTAIFTQDIQLPGMLTALVAHPPRFGAKVESVDDATALASPGVEKVVIIGNGVAVIAKNFWNAKKGRDLLKIIWDESAASRADSAKLNAEYIVLSETAGVSARSEGDAVKAIEAADKMVEAVYELPYLAHAAMEPMNAVVRVDDDGVEVWNGNQLHGLDQNILAQIAGVTPDKVKINTLYAGGSFGRRGNINADYLTEATQIAMAVKGTPVKMVWTREDDTRAGYYRPQYVHRLRAGLDAEGEVQGWLQRIVGSSIMTGTAFEGFMVKDGVDHSSVEGAADLAYELPNLQVELHTTAPGVPVLWWRSVGHSQTAFVTETFIDELATTAGKDPVEYRAARLGADPRHLAVLKMAAEKAGWGSTMPEGKGRGVAVHKSFNSYVAQVAEVSVEGDSFKVDRVVCVVDCGVAINPDVIRAQVEGSIGFGLSAALSSEITLLDGEVQQSNFHDYQVLRIDQMPEVEVYIMPSAEAPTGIGEPGLPPVAPAVANAIAAATGKRLRKLPLRLS